MWSKGSIGRLLGVAVVTVFCGSFALAQGNCPASAPLTGNHCYFIAANGADTNNGTSEATPWLHAPGMPNCSGTCATVQSGFGGPGNVIGGVGIIFRGGDTWHEGNSSSTPYTGGPWNWQWAGTAGSCTYEGTQTGCNYLGVDTTWYNSSVCGSSWCRPVLNEDNAPSTSPISGSCAYQTPSLSTLWPSVGYPSGVSNTMFDLATAAQGYIYLDSFEFTGFCSQNTGNTGINDSIISIGNNGGTLVESLFNNLYIHGWTITTSTAANSGFPCQLIRGANTMLNDITKLVIDGSDSVYGGCSWGYGISFYHFVDSIVRYTSDGVGQACHDIHDFTMEYMFPLTYSADGGHGDWTSHPNTLECNADYESGGASANVVYNLIMRHDSPTQPIGQQHLQLAPPTSTQEYYFNWVVYDLINGEYIGLCKTPAGDCPNTGAAGQFMFNNTLVDIVQPCYTPVDNGVQSLTIANEHLINTPLDGGSGTPCTGYNSATNIVMSDAVATAQGYTSGVTGFSGASNTCANDTTPCAPTAGSNGTVGAGGNYQTYCTALAAFPETAVGVDAANACKYGTTDACAYNTTTHTMVCPAQAPVLRPAKWDSGAYEYNAQDPPPDPPAGLQAVVN